MLRGGWLVLTALVGLWVVESRQPSLYRPQSQVATLRRSNFDRTVLEDQSVWLVEFYAPWCGHCQQLAPEFDAAASMLNGIARLGAVDCDDHSAGDLCQRYEIQGYPTILVFRATPEQKKSGHPAQVHAHHRQGLVDHAVQLLPQQFVSAVRRDNLESFRTQPGPKVLLFTAKRTTTPLFKALSLALRGRMAVGEVHSSQAQVSTQYGVASFPTLLAIGAGGNTTAFHGKLSFPALLEFLEQFAVPKPEEHTHYVVLGLERAASQAEIKKAFRGLSLRYHPDKNPGDAQAAAKFEAAAAAYEVLADEDRRSVYDHELDQDSGEVGDFYRNNPDIQNIEGHGDLQAALGSGDVWVLEFYLPWCEPCQQFSPQFKKLPSAIEAAAIKRRVRLAAVNCDTHGWLCQEMGAHSYPEIQLHTHLGAPPERFQEQERSASKVVEWLRHTLESPVVQLHSVAQIRAEVLQSAELWLVDYYHPNCGPCNALKPTVRRTASQLQGLAKVGLFSCVSSEEANQFCIEQGVTGYPTIIAYGRGTPKSATMLESASDHPAWSALEVASTILRLAQKQPEHS